MQPGSRLSHLVPEEAGPLSANRAMKDAEPELRQSVCSERYIRDFLYYSCPSAACWHLKLRSVARRMSHSSSAPYNGIGVELLSRLLSRKSNMQS